MFVSSLVLAFGYIVALGPVGFISLWVRDLIGYIPWNIYSMTSLIIIAGLTHIPHVFLYAAAALRSVGTDLEEAAKTVGAGPLRVALTISLPMVTPAILYCSVLLFFLGFELFGLPLILGKPSGVSVLATYLYELTNLLGTPSYHLMAVVVVVLIMIAMPLVLLQRFLLRQANLYVSIKGKGIVQKPISLGIWRWPALFMVFAWLAFAVVIPVAALIVRSLVMSWGEGASILNSLTLQHFRDLRDYPGLLQAIGNTILMATVGAAAAVAVFTVINLAAHRWKSGWVRLLDYMILLPRAMPGLVAGLAIFWMFLFLDPLKPFRQTLISIWIAYTLVWLAYGMRLVSSSMLQIAPELEEAARVSGAKPGRVSRDITVPLVRAGLIASWLLMFVTFAREYATGVYLLSPGTEVIGSMLVLMWQSGNVDIVTALAVVNIAITGVGVILMLFAAKR
jgi:iron(III) transport system permease protein